MSEHDSKKPEIYLYLAGISILLAFLFHWGWTEIGHSYKAAYSKEIPIALTWFLELTSPMFFFALLNHWFEHTLWKCSVFKKLNWVSAPNINGEWNAEFATSHDDFKEVHSGKVIIKQSWSRIGVAVTTSSSRSISEISNLTVDASGKTWLIYTYLNEPLPQAAETMHPHRGTCRLSVESNGLTGDYYTGRGRSTNGTIKFVRETSAKEASQ